MHKTLVVTAVSVPVHKSLVATAVSVPVPKTLVSRLRDRYLEVSWGSAQTGGEGREE